MSKSGDPLVPEDFDLDAARRAYSTTPADDQPECPSCESIKIHEKRRNPARRTYPEPYRCDACGEHFDEPERPEREGG